jgi:hypothetical protein
VQLVCRDSIGSLYGIRKPTALSDGLPIGVETSCWPPGAMNGINPMTGTANQADWAEQIKARVNTEFDRVAKALASAATRQTEQNRTDTVAIIAILEDKRAAVMGHDQAGYFIHDWQELRDQVRQMIIQDSRYKAIMANKELARRVPQIN